MQNSEILIVDKLSKYFGGLAAVDNCSIKIKKGSITGIIGPNGSGKTTLFNLIAGNLKSTNGNVFFNKENITNIPSYQLFSKGILRTFQIAHEFTNLTVLENLMMVPGNQSGENLVTALLKPKLVKKEEENLKIKAFEVIHGMIKANGYLFNNVAYISDCNKIPSLSLKNLYKLKFLIIDCLKMEKHPSHFCYQEALDLVKLIKPKKTILTNLHTDLDYESLNKRLPKHIVAAYDGISFSF